MLSDLTLCCHLAKFPRNPVPGGESISRPRSQGSGGASLPSRQEFMMNEQQSLERAGTIPPNTRFGPCDRVQSFETAGGGTVSVRVPNHQASSRIPAGTMVWVHISSGENALATLSKIDVDGDDDAKSLATTDDENDDAEMLEQAPSDDESMASVAASGFRSRSPLLRSLVQHWTTFKTPLVNLARGNLLQRSLKWKSLKTRLRGATFRRPKVTHVAKQLCLQFFEVSVFRM